MTKAQGDDLNAVRTVVAALEGFDEKEKERILRWAREKLGLPEILAGSQVPPAPRPAPTLGPAPVPAAPAVPSGQASDIKSFVERKNPSSDTQFAATVAYYFRFEAPDHLRKESITKEDIQEACRRVGRTRIRHLAQTLVNAHRQGLLDRGEPGTYVINTVGENLVAMALPSEGSVRLRSRTKPASTAQRGSKRPTKKKASRRPPKS